MIYIIQFLAFKSNSKGNYVISITDLYGIEDDTNQGYETLIIEVDRNFNTNSWISFSNFNVNSGTLSNIKL